MATTMSWRKTAVTWAIVGVAMAGLRAARAQSPGSTSIQQGQSIPIRGGSHPPDDNGSIPPATMEKLNLARNAQRQKQLVEDTDKLLELATQLKADVDKTDKNVLSIDVIKRAEQIEKLARAVKERMKG
jgi:hypothetical protein